MLIIGICDDHGASAALMRDGELLYAASEERFTRIKNDAGFPIKAIDAGLEAHGFSYNDIDQVAVVSEQHYDYMSFAYKRNVLLSIADHKNLMRTYWRPKLAGLKYPKDQLMVELRKKPEFSETNFYGIEYLGESDDPQLNLNVRAKIVQSISQHFTISPEQVVFVDHHGCHVYQAYFSDQRNLDAPVIGVTVDGWGDGCNQTVWSITGPEHFEKIAESGECELARLYRFTTLFLSMKPLEHEYKVMGLAPYAKAEYSSEVQEIFQEIIQVDGMKIVHKRRPADLYRFIEDKLSSHRFDNIARGLQDFLEETLISLFSNIAAATGCGRFVYSGGVAMNVKANKRLSEQSFVDYFFVPGAPDDQGTAIGACFIANNMSGNNKPIEHLYLGHVIERGEVQEVVKKLRPSNVAVTDASTTQIATLLVEGKVVARASGPMEFGARALGNRSILALPNNWDVVETINEMIKGRDFWMPFAGSILEEDALRYIVNPKGIRGTYMTMAFETTAAYYEHFKAATHRYDKTIRPQIVYRKDNPWYYDLLVEIKHLTGHGVLLNTSLNIHGSPIVCSAKEAFEVFLETNLSHIVIGDKLFRKMS